MASKFIQVTVFVLDLIAFLLAVAAEQRRSSARIATDSNMNYCVYDTDIATGLGVGALLFLLVGQLIIMVATKCLCCGRSHQPGRSWVWEIVFFIICWVTFFIAEECLLAASVRNAYHTKYRTYLSQPPPSCDTLRKGVFGAGAAFIVFTCILSELFYISYSKTGDGFSTNGRDSGIRMGTL